MFKKFMFKKYLKKSIKECLDASREMDKIYNDDRCSKCRILTEKRYSIPSENGEFIMVCHKCYLNYKAELNRKEADKNINNFDAKSVNHSKIPYCESPALGMGAPECSEDCSIYGSCHRDAYYRHIDNKYPLSEGLYKSNSTRNTNNSARGYAQSFNWQFDKFVIEDREYSSNEVMEILKKHKAEEDKNFHKCERCGEKYLENISVNMTKENLDEKPKNCSVWGYASTPFITGFKVTAKCGRGREIKLCDNCVKELLNFLKGRKI